MIVVFDLGGVLADGDECFRRLSSRLGIDTDVLKPAWWAHRAPYDAGCSDLDFWGPVGADLGFEVDEALAVELGRLDADGWAVIRDDARQVLADLDAAGVPTAVLSNAPIEMYEALDRSDWRDLVGPLFVSGVLGVVKPDPTLYEHVQTTLDLPADQIWFIDDRQPNVDAALAQGWHAHLWTSDADTRSWLEREGFLRAS